MSKLQKAVSLAQEEAAESVWNLMEPKLHQFYDETFHFRHIAIIIGENDERVHKRVNDFFQQRYNKLFSDISPNSSRSCGSSATVLPEENQAVCVRRWKDISSAEWPIVFHITCAPNWFFLVEGDNLAHTRYRARTRATVKLIEITATYDDPNDLSDRQKYFFEEVRNWNYAEFCIFNF